MTRVRRRINAQLPKYVYRRTYGFILRPYLGMQAGRRMYGKEINLCPADTPLEDVWAAYRRETKKDSETLRWLLGEFHASKKFRSLKPRTQTEYEGYRKTLLTYPMKNGKPFGSARIADIKRTAIQKYLDKYPAPIAANRHIQYLKSAWNWSLNRFEHVPENPCVGVELNKQAPRDRYVTPEEYAAIHSRTEGWVHWAMELAYLCRARRVEIVNLRMDDVLEEGLRLQRAKGSEGEITKWTPRLRAAVEGAVAHSYKGVSPIGDARLLLNNQGKPITVAAWNSALKRLRPVMDELGIERFTLHDLKAAGYSDQKQQDAGHRSEKMHKTYNRKLRIIEPPD